jgi:hypothetical protein
VVILFVSPLFIRGVTSHEGHNYVAFYHLKISEIWPDKIFVRSSHTLLMQIYNTETGEKLPDKGDLSAPSPDISP